MRSKRKSFRFKSFQFPVKFRTPYEDGEALLENISISGCALEELTIDLRIGDAFLLQIEDETLENPIEAQAIVVRSDSGSVAAHFSLIGEDTQKMIRKFFSLKKNGS
ncbi:MAG: PilZ domain-containing protein [Desulfobulbaceae bacterium]|nr:MAG: PilZ domain-containing protein [Desulfobulbaceae bacterium]